MKLPAKRLYAAAIAVCLLAGSQARADFVSWSYLWTPDNTTITADNPAMGQLNLTPSTSGSAVNNTFTVATNITTKSSADPTNPATFTDRPYTLFLTIFDQASGKSDNLAFSGKINGTLSNGSAILNNTFTSPETQSVQIGQHQYSVKIGPFAPPGPPTANISGSISALATVTVNDVPEPNTLVLSGLGLSLFGGWWWKRQRARRPALELA
jgi:hypothetical protein